MHFSRGSRRRSCSQAAWFALDSWAVLHRLEGAEPAASRVEEAFDVDRPVMRWINLGEVVCVVRRDQDVAEAHEVVRDLRPQPRLDLPSEQRIVSAATLEADHRMAYADAFAAATAIAHHATLLTGDAELLVDDAPWDWEDLRTPPAR